MRPVQERDYYPYWHPTPWHDIAIFTDEPQERCEYLRAESQNVKEKGRCSINQHNNPDACTGNGGEPWPQRTRKGNSEEIRPCCDMFSRM